MNVQLVKVKRVSWKTLTILKNNNENTIRWHFTRHRFPSIDVVRQVIKCGKDRYDMFKNLYNNVIIKNDYEEEELFDAIHEHKHNFYKTLADINKKNIKHIDNIQRGWFKAGYEPVITTQASQGRFW